MSEAGAGMRMDPKIVMRSKDLGDAELLAMLRASPAFASTAEAQLAKYRADPRIVIFTVDPGPGYSGLCWRFDEPWGPVVLVEGVVVCEPGVVNRSRGWHHFLEGGPFRMACAMPFMGHLTRAQAARVAQYEDEAAFQAAYEADESVGLSAAVYVGEELRRYGRLLGEQGIVIRSSPSGECAP